MNSQEIQKAIGKMQVLKLHSPVIENIQPFYKYEYDVFSVSKSGMVCEFEVKISRSDFLRQKEKIKMSEYSEIIIQGHYKRVTIPNYFSYCCPEGLIKQSEIPKFAGLFYFHENGEIAEIQTPKKIHKHEFELKNTIKKILRYYSERKYLGSCRMTYENKLSTETYAKYFQQETN